MSWPSRHIEAGTLNVGIDPPLRSDFQSATARGPMWNVHGRWPAEARRQFQLVAERAADPESDEAGGAGFNEDASVTAGADRLSKRLRRQRIRFSHPRAGGPPLDTVRYPDTVPNRPSQARFSGVERSARYSAPTQPGQPSRSISANTVA